MQNILVIGGYKCGCTFGPIRIKDRLEYCGVHGADVANEYDVSPSAHLTPRPPELSTCTCKVFMPSGESTSPICRFCGKPPIR